MLGPRPARLPALIGLAVLGVIAGLALVAFFSLPRLSLFSPTAGAQNVSSQAHLQLTFNRPMNQASVETALQMTPPLPGAFAWEGNSVTFTPAQPWPLNSTITITLMSGAIKSAQGLPLLGEHQWTFTVGGKRLAYLTGQIPNLWIITSGEEASPRPITTEAIGIYDFAISPDGTHFLYSALRADGGADLRAVSLEGTDPTDFLACPGAACLAPAFAPNGKRIAYERHTLVPGLKQAATFGDSHVHLYTPATGTDEVLGDPTEGETLFPRWGPDGRLSYFDTARQAIVIQDIASGSVTYVPDLSGEMGTWSPDGQFIVFPEIFFPSELTPEAGATEPSGESEEGHNENFFSHLLRVTIATNEAQNLSGTGIVEDASPTYSPSGDWLAFARKSLVSDQWTPGRQLWLMRPDGSEAHPLTTAPLYNHSAFIWSADGTELAYMRFNAADPATPAEIWTIPLSGNGAHKLVSGYLPEWLP
jgi:Tol biopolymer transport system component